MKDITFAVPCYNSQEYMRKCVDSLLPGGDRVEIIIVDDGSKDETGAIADEYAEKYPGIVRAVHQQTRGHGGAINHALELATGRFFKVVDSDDWAGERAYKQVMRAIASFNKSEHWPDMIIVDYVYDKVGVKKKTMMRYKNCFPQNRFFGWDEFGHTNLHQYLLMHAVIYQTEILRKSGVKLPEHRFYVDNLFVFIPLPYVNEMFYLDVDFYHYFIGREDQSVNEKVMISRIDQQLQVTRELIDDFSFEGHKRLVWYRRRYIGIMLEVSSVLCVASKDPALYQKKKELWKYLKDKNPKLYRKMRYNEFGLTCNLPTPLGRKIFLAGYHFTNKLYGFN